MRQTVFYVRFDDAATIEQATYHDAMMTARQHDGGAYVIRETNGHAKTLAAFNCGTLIYGLPIVRRDTARRFGLTCNV